MRIAITGGIACGKSLVGELFAAEGWQVCEADQVAHGLYAPEGPAYQAVCALGGEDIVRDDGTIDRALLAQRVFADPSKLAALNAILHPLVDQEIVKWLQVCKRDGATGAAVIIPLLFEAGMQDGWDAVICVGCRAATQRERLLQRGLDEDAIQSRVASQWPIEKKMSLADYQIWNDGDRNALYAAVKNVVKRVSERK